MIIQNIGGRALSLYIDQPELDTLGLSPESVGCQEAHKILSRALTDRAIKNWEAAEMEVFPGRDSVLLFARRKSEKPWYFRFEDSECMICAALLCPSGIPSALTASPDGYILTVYPLEGDKPPSVLSEYGDLLHIEPELSLHYAEQGGNIIRHYALDTLKQYFKM